MLDRVPFLQLVLVKGIHWVVHSAVQVVRELVLLQSAQEVLRDLCYLFTGNIGHQKVLDVLHVVHQGLLLLGVQSEILYIDVFQGS